VFNAQNNSLDPCTSLLAIPSNPSWTSQTNKIYSACPNVKIGVGTTDPTHSIHTPYDARFGQVKVDFNQGIGAEPTGFSKLFIKNQNQDAAIEIDQSGNSKIYQKLMVFQYTNPTTEVLKVYNPTNNQIAYLFEANGKMTVSNNGTKIFQLNTNGLLRVRNVRVDTENWPDYVFQKSYQLKPLSEIEKYIHINGHLPNIPFSKEILEQGIDVAEMNVKLLEKIEELTLHLIALEKQLNKLQQKIHKKNNNRHL
jgi:hypothetical protein